MTSLNCQICDEKFNKTARSSVECPYCAFQACRTCCKTYILDKTVSVCMNTACGKEWTRKQLRQLFPLSFVTGEWKAHRAEILLQREFGLLPATQVVVEREIKNEKYRSDLKKIEENIQKLMGQRNRINQLLRRPDPDNLNNGEANSQRKVFVRACPDEVCRGFLSSQWKCGICDQYSCPDCHVIIGKDKSVEHVCNPDELATAKLLQKDTKCCPKCATGIFKIEGCDQMWCTQCHTAFSWRTGMIETNIHNPHYYEWMRRNNGQAPRNHGDVCAGEINHRTASIINDIIGQKDANMCLVKRCYLTDAVINIVRGIMHFRTQMVTYRLDPVENNLALRVKYMRNKITKEDFKTQVQRENKKYEKKREIYQVLELFNTTVNDVMHRLQVTVRAMPRQNHDNFEAALKIVQEIDGIQTYANECLLDIANTYNSKPKKIVMHYTNDWASVYDILVSA